ncbi:MAG: sugar phosphate isomerase/epimerase [Verrucomicrobia bacterium]|nr:sugar phosphate isomerase/epimerase [Verrucomicrobiota bacterium]MDA1086075.1 sugar phosphate isomerase/epimerase [Verrucomicrobiota bacterium]
MKLGFLTGSYQDIEKAANLGFRAIELHVGAFGNPETEDLDSAKIDEAVALMKQHDIEISALAYYTFCRCTEDRIKSEPTFYGRVFDAAEKLGVGVVAAMGGFHGGLNWDDNIKLFGDRFGPVAELAEKRGMKIAFENWMSVHGRLPHTPINIGGSPGTWDDMFGAVPSKALGIEFDPSHLYWQGIDHVRALKEYADRVYHVHAKDTEMIPENRYRYGINGDIFRFRIPGYGEINWFEFISALDEIGYSGGVAIEHEDPIYSGDRFDEGLVRGHHVLDPIIK